MTDSATFARRRLLAPALAALVCLLGTLDLRGAQAPGGEYRYRILSVENAAPGLQPVVTFAVVNPTTGELYDLRAHPAWTQKASGASRLFLQIAWDTRDFTNTGSGSNAVPGGRGAALPIPIDALGSSVVSNGDGTYEVQSPLPVPMTASGTGRVALEGHPAGQDATGAWTVRVPVRSAFRDFVITGAAPEPRRSIVDVNKCMNCHRSDGTGVAPRLTAHGNNRTEEPGVCVVCHNPNNTDIPFRKVTDAPVLIGPYSYPEQSIDFKTMIHGIHASAKGFRKEPLVVIGRNGAVFDASALEEYPGSLRNCAACHIDNGVRGTFELPLAPTVLGTTFASGSIANGTVSIDTDPENDVKITPIAAVCSSCHDDRENVEHMVRVGRASFATSQAAIAAGSVRETCVTCHGPGKARSVRRMHPSHD